MTGKKRIFAGMGILLGVLVGALNFHPKITKESINNAPFIPK